MSGFRENNQTVACKTCSTTFAVSDLFGHYKTEVKEGPFPKTYKLTFRCPECGCKSRDHLLRKV